MSKILKSVTSKNGNKIDLIEIENPHKKDLKINEKSKILLIIGVFHGDEIDGEFLINKFLLSNKSNFTNRILVIPCLNPDGKFLKTRQNSNKVDLNRNFPTRNWILNNDPNYFGGTSPASEIETRFIIDILNEYTIDCILSLHAPYKVVNYDGPAIKIAEKISKITNYPLEENIGYPTPGSFGTYAGIEKQIPVITLELPENEPLENLWKTIKPVFEYFVNIS